MAIDRYAEIKEKIIRYAKEQEAVRAVIAIGSSTRTDTPADEYSDLDLLIVTNDPDPWFSGEISPLFGNVRISFIEPTLGGGRERRNIYDLDKDVDMIVLTPEQFDRALKEGVAGWVMNRGYRMLYDPDGYALPAEQYVHPVLLSPEMTEKEFTNLVNDFFFHNIWACKKLLRGELWSAKMCIDAYLKNYLLKMIEQHHLVTAGGDVWHDGRFLDRWADPAVLEALKDCFAHYDSRDCERALLATHRLFARIARTVAEKRGFPYPIDAEACAAEYLANHMN
ncbi:MAG: aminoglycoside 6-adenylyltransferase [Lachnospiraceae bacterium]|nr:aminoglycoside 6-adenylyltransferase [Lachnospiraceae bacterium]